MGEGLWDMKDFAATPKKTIKNLNFIANGSMAHKAIFSTHVPSS